jgi:peptidoglycan-associated lipoprotein
VCLALALVTSCSCAKKQVPVSEGIQTSAGPAAEVGPAGEGEPEAVVGAGQTGSDVQMGDLDDRRRLEEEMKAFSEENIYFDFDKAELKTEAKVVLKAKADWLRKHQDYSVRIEGHCDERGTNEYNLALGERRADAAKRFLVALGISADRISTISYGEEKPLDPGHDEGAWAKNRRCDGWQLTEAS